MMHLREIIRRGQRKNSGGPGILLERSLMDEPLMARDPAFLPDKFPDADPRPLLSLLGRLLIRMDPSGDDASIDGPADRPVDRWEDDAYIYLEAILPDARSRGVDVCVHEGKVNIRIAK
jgi:HSP20 family molecular chaperone IbpA